jgi:hypothetical protein
MTSRPLQVALLAVFAIGWVIRAMITYYDEKIGGLFGWIGIDFGFYLSQARAVAAGDMAALYSIDEMQRYGQTLAAFAAGHPAAFPAGPVPYPPIFAWLMSPFAGLSPPVAFAIWTLINVATVAALAWRVVSLFPAEQRLLAATVLLASTPLVFSLWFGQIQVFLALAFGEAFLALRKGRDLGAGLWLSALILKPQYLLIALPVLVWKRRWRALGGFIAGGLAILVASTIVAGPTTVAAYFGSFLESATAAGGTVFTAVAPHVMVNWRALVLALPVDLSGTVRTVITLILSGVTVAVVVAAWRGPWNPAGPRFAGQVTLLAVGTVLAAYHSHVHGALMIAVPLAAYFAGTRPVDARERLLETGIRIALATAIFAPWLWFVVLGRGHENANLMLALALVAGLLLVGGKLLLVTPSSPDAEGQVAEDQAPAVTPA